jgi:hypothetical protein
VEPIGSIRLFVLIVYNRLLQLQKTNYKRSLFYFFSYFTFHPSKTPTKRDSHLFSPTNDHVQYNIRFLLYVLVQNVTKDCHKTICLPHDRFPMDRMSLRIYQIDLRSFISPGSHIVH